MTLPENPYAYEGSAPTRGDSPPVDVIYWIPDESVTLHNGKPIPRRMVFPYPPPPEIGRVMSADGHHGRNFLVETIAVIAIAGCMVYLFVYKTNAWLLAILLTASLTSVFRSAPLSRYFLQFFSEERRNFPTLTYVGDQGFAEFYRGAIHGGLQIKVFLYEAVASIQDGHCRGSSGQVLFTACDLIEAWGKEQAYTPYEVAIGRAVSAHILARWLAQIEAGERIQILLAFQEVLLISKTQIDFYHRYGCQKELNKNDILKISLTYDGHLMFYLHEHLSPANHGRFKYALRDISNVRAVLLLLPKLLQVPLLGKRLS